MTMKEVQELVLVVWLAAPRSATRTRQFNPSLYYDLWFINYERFRPKASILQEPILTAVAFCAWLQRKRENTALNMLCTSHTKFKSIKES